MLGSINTVINTEIIYLTCFCDLSSNCFVVGYLVLHDKKGRNTNEYTIYGIQIHGQKRICNYPMLDHILLYRGRHSAVAIATPGIDCLSTLVMAIAPTNPPKKGNKNIVNIR
jgi:hypothetical protein